MRVTRTIASLLPLLAAFLLAACDLPFGLGQPATRALENGAAASLQGSFEMTGGYMASGTSVHVDVQVADAKHQRIVLTGDGPQLEVLVVDHVTYFRGHDFLAQHLGSDARSQAFLAVADDRWWRGLLTGAVPPDMPDFSTGSGLTATFLGSAVTRRSDHAAVDGVPAVELSGPRGDVFISAQPPYRPLRVREAPAAVVDGLSGADFRYGNFGDRFAVQDPDQVIDFTSLSTLPPIYTVVNVDTSGCTQPCVLVATVRNLGGLKPARGHSTVSFKMTDTAGGFVLGGCTAAISPDVGFNATTTASCTIFGLNNLQGSSATVTATPTNPGP